MSEPGSVRMAGAVLAGGHSSRMGRTKALIEIDGVPMARRVGLALEAGGCERVVIVGGDAAELAPLGWEVIPDLRPGRRGPVAGVDAALASLGVDADAVMVVACDLPALDAATVVAFLTAFRGAAPRPDVVVARTDRREPACALWNPTFREVVRRALDGGDPSLHEVIGAAARVVEIDVAAEVLHNVNTPADLPR